jgi:putative transcriptional regulator
MEPSVLNRVKDLRTARAWTQEHLATATGVSRQSINSIERGRYIPSLPLALLLAQVFETPLDQIFSLEKNP